MASPSASPFASLGIWQNMTFKSIGNSFIYFRINSPLGQAIAFLQLLSTSTIQEGKIKHSFIYMLIWYLLYLDLQNPRALEKGNTFDPFSFLITSPIFNGPRFSCRLSSILILYPLLCPCASAICQSLKSLRLWNLDHLKTSSSSDEYQDTGAPQNSPHSINENLILARSDFHEDPFHWWSCCFSLSTNTMEFN